MQVPQASKRKVNPIFLSVHKTPNNSPTCVTHRSHAQSSLFTHNSHNRLLRKRQISPQRLNLQPHRTQELGPLRARALPGSHHRHHGQVGAGRLPVHARVREDHFVNQDARGGGHGGRDVGEDLPAFVVAPVVEDVAEVVEFGA